jgi:hypothetical protein
MKTVASNFDPPLPMLGSVPPVDGQPGAEQSGLIEGLDLPREVSLAEAATIANCDKKTIVRYMQDGLLEWRNIAPPSSSRPTYRLKLASVVALRTAYCHESPVRHHRVDEPAPTIRPLSRPAAGDHQFKHVRLGRS